MVNLNEYYQVLEQIQIMLRPRTYLEVGVRHGESWRLASPQTLSIGIDPEPRLTHAIRSKASLFSGTSDAFFESRDARSIFGGLDVDLAFIDGMHNFEFALRDFINIEKVSSKRSIVLLHDCLPIDEMTSTREMNTSIWSGDIWKVVVCLKEQRPDLSIDVLDVGPTGLGIIQNLNPLDRHLEENYQKIEEKYLSLPYLSLGQGSELRRNLNVCRYLPAVVEELCGPANRFRSLSTLARNKKSFGHQKEVSAP